MSIKKALLCVTLSPMLVNGMQETSVNFATAQSRKERITELRKEYLELNSSEQLVCPLKKTPSKKVDQYVGPKVWDTCCSNLYLDAATFAIADQDEFSTDIFNAQPPFSKVASLKSPDMPCGLPALAKNNTNQLATTAAQTIILWDLLKHQEIIQLKGHSNLITSVSFDPANPSQIVSSSNDGTLRAWDTRSGQCTQKLQAQGRVVSADVQPGGTGQVASIIAGATRNLAIWSLAMNKVLSTSSGESTVKYNHSGSSLLTSIPGGVLLYDGTTYTLQSSLILPGNWSACGAQVMSADFTADDSRVVMSGSDYNIFICDGLLKAVQANFDSGMMGVDVHFNENATQILSSAFGAPYDSGPAVRIWEPQTFPLLMRKPADSYKCILQ